MDNLLEKGANANILVADQYEVGNPMSLPLDCALRVGRFDIAIPFCQHRLSRFIRHLETWVGKSDEYKRCPLLKKGLSLFGYYSNLQERTFEAAQHLQNLLADMLNLRRLGWHIWDRLDKYGLEKYDDVLHQGELGTIYERIRDVIRTVDDDKDNRYWLY